MRRINIYLAALTFISLVGSAAPAWSWGDLGHRIVCEMAFDELNSKARREVRRLVRKDPDPDLRLFFNACTWPDHPRKRASEHFVNVPRDVDRFTAATYPVAATCLLTTIAADLQILRTATDDQVKLEALKFLGHWVGDLHQPLHVPFEDDRGGNHVLEVGPCDHNLHSVWDGCIIERQIGDQPRPVAEDLLATITDTDREIWRATPMEDWANESLEITRRATVGYCVLTGAKCAYDVGRDEYHEGEVEKAVTVDTPYLQLHAPLVADRLKRAGVRLGHLLNLSLGQ